MIVKSRQAWSAEPDLTGRALEPFRVSLNREKALSFCFVAVPDGKPLHTFPGTALIEGFVKGDIHARNVWLGKTSRLVGNIFADQVAVEGEVQGLIYARQIRLGASSRVRGTIISHLLAIEPGADFEGKCRSLTRLLQHRSLPLHDGAALAAE